MRDCVVVTPIYKQSFNADELAAVRHSHEKLCAHDTVLIGPDNLDTGYYRELLPHAKIVPFSTDYFRSAHDYSRLLLSPFFYDSFSDYEFMLICQPDAVVFSGDLGSWLSMPYDYIGAPWPRPLPHRFKSDSFPILEALELRGRVGNGGLSLRRGRRIRELLCEFPDALVDWVVRGDPEDLYISIAGSVSRDFVLPSVFTAAHFSHECNPSLINSMIGGAMPFGCHAWGYYEPDFWRSRPYWPKTIL